jgi:hypothetical protein
MESGNHRNGAPPMIRGMPPDEMELPASYGMKFVPRNLGPRQQMGAPTGLNIFFRRGYPDGQWGPVPPRALAVRGLQGRPSKWAVAPFVILAKTPQIGPTISRTVANLFPPPLFQRGFIPGLEKREGKPHALHQIKLCGCPLRSMSPPHGGCPPACSNPPLAAEPGEESTPTPTNGTTPPQSPSLSSRRGGFPPPPPRGNSPRPEFDEAGEAITPGSFLPPRHEKCSPGRPYKGDRPRPAEVF